VKGLQAEAVGAEVFFQFFDAVLALGAVVVEAPDCESASNFDPRDSTLK
jgi:hypothetical protein